MKDLYIIVHEEATKENWRVRKEVNRIKREELYILVNDNPTEVEYKIPKNSTLYVCGAYHGKQHGDHRCVDEQVKALKRRGYHAELYLPATISLNP